MWLFYNVRNEHTSYVDGAPGTGIVCDRLVAPDLLADRPRAVVSPSQRWEGNRDGGFFWNEAPYVLKRRGTYFLMYSGGSFYDDTYAIGVARAAAPEGPWEKLAANPVVRGTDVVRGPGHHSFIAAPDVATRYAVYHAYVEGEPGRKVCIDRMHWLGDRPTVWGPTHEAQPRPPQPLYDEEVPHWVAETWARGSWVEVRGRRFQLDPLDVWHQVEVAQVNDRYAVRVGGVLRASRPASGGHRGPEFAAEGATGPTTISTCGTDAALRALPGRSTYTWRWGGSTPLELTFAARGDVAIFVGDEPTVSRGAKDEFRLVDHAFPRGAETITIEAGDDGATVGDVVAYARGAA